MTSVKSMFMMKSIHCMNLAAINLNLLVALDAVLATRNVTEAARRTGLSQPAMSNALARLRRLLDDPLLVRTPRGLVPTARGAELTGAVRQILDEMERVLAPPRFDAASCTRTFRVGSGSMSEIAHAPLLQSQLQHEAPRVRMRWIDVVGQAGPQPPLESGAADVVLGRARPTLPPGLRFRYLFDSRPGALVRRDHPLVGEHLDRETLGRLSLVAVSSMQAPITQRLAAAGIPLTVALSLSAAASVPYVVARTDYCAILPLVLGRAAVAYFPVRHLPLPVDMGSVPVGLYWHERTEHDPAARWFRDRMADVILQVERAYDAQTALASPSTSVSP
jgi:DNA-binding transcriptional LysR family regulator